jgi:hypothetical protein
MSTKGKFVDTFREGYVFVIHLEEGISRVGTSKAPWNRVKRYDKATLFWCRKTYDSVGSLKLVRDLLGQFCMTVPGCSDCECYEFTSSHLARICNMALDIREEILLKKGLEETMKTLKHAQETL